MEDLFTKLLGSIVSSGPLVTLLALILYSGYKGYWVWGTQLEECRKREEEWKDLAKRNMGIADRSLTLVEKK